MPSGVLTVSFSAGSAPPISLVASLTQAGGSAAVHRTRRGASGRRTAARRAARIIFARPIATNSVPEPPIVT